MKHPKLGSQLHAVHLVHQNVQNKEVKFHTILNIGQQCPGIFVAGDAVRNALIIQNLCCHTGDLLPVCLDIITDSNIKLSAARVCHDRTSIQKR